jgi:hypothetical protein
MNLQADAMTRAAQIAAGALKSKWRDQRAQAFRISTQRAPEGDWRVSRTASGDRGTSREGSRKLAFETHKWCTKAEPLKSLRIFCAPLVFKIQPMEIEDDHRLFKS